MKKLENPKLEERRDYLRNVILPRLQGMQRDLFGNEILTLETDIGTDGRFVTAFSAVIINGVIRDRISLHLCIYDSREKIDSDYTKLLNFIVLHMAAQ